MKTLLRLLLVIFVGVPLVIFLYLSYLGVIPGASKLFGGVKPRNLSVSYSKENYNSYLKKADFKVEESTEPKSGKSIEFSGKTEIKQTFTQEEISSRLNYSNWKYMPIANVQIRINQDKTVELSANLKNDRLAEFVQAVGGGSYSGEKVDEALDFLNKLPPDLPVYAKFTAQVSDNKADVSVETLQIGRLALPLNKFGGDAAIEAVVNHVFEIVPGFYAKAVTFEDGKMNFEGSAPNQVLLQTN